MYKQKYFCRFGWFIPKQLVRDTDLERTFWKTFLINDTAKLFSFTKQEMDHLSNFTKESSGYV